MKSFTRPLLLVLVAFLTIPSLYGQTISGKVTAAETGEELIGAALVFYDSTGVYETGTSTDIDGNYIVQVKSSAAWVDVTYVGYSIKRIPLDGQANIDVALNIALEDEHIITCWVVVGHSVPMINLDFQTSGQIFTSDQIRNSSN